MSATPVTGPNGFPRWEKDPTDVLDYVEDFAVWLGADTIVSVVFTVPTGITKDSHSFTATTVTVWLSGGTHGKLYRVSCQIVTAGARTRKKSFEVLVKNQ